MRPRTLFVLLLILMAALVSGQDKKPVAQWQGEIQNGKLLLTAAIDKGWHVYSTTPVQGGPFATQIEAKGLTLGKEIEEKGLRKEKDDNFGLVVGFWADKAEISVPVTSGTKGEVTVTYQACNDHECLPPTPATVSVDKPVAGANADTGAAESQGPLLPFFFASILGGFLALLTPCVFPMIPITISVFSKQSNGKPVPRAVAFCLGIIATFTILGLATSIVFGANGLQIFANNPWLNLFLGGLFVVLSLSLFGVYEFTLPGVLANRVNTQGKGDFVGPVLMGLVFSLTSFTCTVPVVGTLLVAAAQGERIYPLVGMIGFSSAFALPFFLLALFPSALAKMPKSGGWLATVKASMGFLELAAAMKFFSTVDLSFGLGWLTKPVFLSIWIVLAAMAAAYLLGWVRLPSVHDGKPGPLRLAFGIGTAVLAVWLLGGLNDRSLKELEAFLPPDPYPSLVGATDAPKAIVEAGWHPVYEDALAEAKQTGKNVFIDFTGIYCTNCRYMEKNVFPDERVKSRFEKFVLAKLYTDRPTSEEDKRYEALKERLTNNAANPVYAIVTPEGELVAKHAYERDIDVFADFLQKGILASTVAKK
ncbi:cytochrome c biogenesis protein CcdA [soil metagenome]